MNEPRSRHSEEGLKARGRISPSSENNEILRSAQNDVTRFPLPHGGTLVQKVFNPEAVSEEARRAKALASLRLNKRQIADIKMITTGGFSPLEGFLGKEDYNSVVDSCHLQDGAVWSIPITLRVSAEETAPLKEGQDVALLGPDGAFVGILHLQEKYSGDKKWEAREVFRTEEDRHPGVAALYAQGDTLLGGSIEAVELPEEDPALSPYRLTPSETRKAFAQRGWQRVVGFQTRNPVHRAHEYIQKCALEICDGLLLHPLVGETKSDDIPSEIRMKCYEVLLSQYYPKDRTLLALNPSNMYYAGPREAILHAIVRKNFGCTHFIVGRDHAGVGNYYGPYDAQKIFSAFQPEEIGIIPLFFENTCWCYKRGSMASEKTCPHAPEQRLNLSGTKVREALQKGQDLPPEFTRPEVAQILKNFYQTTPKS